MSRLSISLLMLPLCLCAAMHPAAAQRFAFDGIPWQTPADSVRASLRAGGFTFSRDMDEGDLEFTRADGARMQAQFRAGRLIGLTLIDPAAPARVSGRFQVLADSLRAVLGAPDDTTARPREHAWEAGFTSLRLWVLPIASREELHTVWRGPGWHDEMLRRREEPAPPRGYTVVTESPFMRIAVDTTVRGPRGAAALRGRFRIDYPQPITPTVDGVAQEPLDAVEYEMEFDCAGRRTRLVARTTYLEGRQQGTHRPQGQPWTTPRQPDGHYARGLTAVCRANRPARPSPGGA